MKHTNTLPFVKKAAAPVAGLAVLAAGIVSAAATDPIPNPLPNAVAGNVIQASDINDLVTAVGILDERTAAFQNEDIFVDASGNVGIGTTTPLSKLHVSSAISTADGGSGFYGWGQVAPEEGDLDYSRNNGSNHVYRINHHTGLSLSAHSSYGGIRFYNQGYDGVSSNPYASNGASLVMAISDQNVYLSNQASAAGTNGYACFDSSGRLFQKATACDL